TITNNNPLKVGSAPSASIALGNTIAQQNTTASSALTNSFTTSQSNDTHIHQSSTDLYQKRISSKLCDFYDFWNGGGCRHGDECKKRKKTKKNKQKQTKTKQKQNKNKPKNNKNKQKQTKQKQ